MREKRPIYEGKETHIYTYTHICIHTYTYICIHMCVCVYIYIQFRVQSLEFSYLFPRCGVAAKVLTGGGVTGCDRVR